MEACVGTNGSLFHFRVHYYQGSIKLMGGGFTVWTGITTKGFTFKFNA